MSDDPGQTPARLLQEPTEVGALLTKTEALFRGNFNEARAWTRIKPVLDGVSIRPRLRRRILVIGVVTSASILALGWYAGIRYAKPAEAAPSLARTSARSARPCFSERGKLR